MVAHLVGSDQAAYHLLLVPHRYTLIGELSDITGTRTSWSFGDGDLKSTPHAVVPRYCAFIQRGINDPDILFRKVRRASHARP